MAHGVHNNNNTNNNKYFSLWPMLRQWSRQNRSWLETREWISALLTTALAGKRQTTEVFMVFPAMWLLEGWHEVTDLVWRALCKANVPSVKEPSELVTDDGKCPNGSALIAWPAAKSMTWDVTVVNTLAESYLTISASLGGTAEHAAERKSAKYLSLPSFHIFWLWRLLALWTQLAFHS